MAPTSPTYPVSLILSGRSCLVVGGGARAVARAGGLLEAGALVTVVARSSDVELRALPVRLEERPYRHGEAGGYHLVVAATGVRATDEEVCADAEAAGVLVNCVDWAAASSFICPAVLRRGALSVAVSSGGSAPALSTYVRNEAAARFGPEYAAVAELLALGRAAIHEAGASTEGLDWHALVAELLEVLAGDRPPPPGAGPSETTTELAAARLWGFVERAVGAGATRPERPGPKQRAE